MRTERPYGDVIYQTKEYIIHQIDGEDFKVCREAAAVLYCQNLSLFAKLFLETKSVFFDAATFLYYTLILPSGQDAASPQRYGQVVGFFSKEKMSWDNNNLACICIFPPWQRRGLGQVLMSASYVLGKREGRFGGPERPLSTLGKKGYTAYWCGEVARYLLSCPKQKVVKVKTISEKTWIMLEDVVLALKEMDVLAKGEEGASGDLVVNKSKVREWAEKNQMSMRPVVDLNGFVADEQSTPASEEEMDD